ncbi:hypothetical protein PL75_01165 [Neisseria arctica]|uniref:M23ase beta-sheet core domain-containing protein n=1 Tax=Neisseria arctica TaxID=1470200 RepID=A0A0J0YU14_9NEIS|nr:M23 family metallopeptidase [Neisseria arctica]KLT73591.1 hypothetical protein PL75_01165 [Neisseria arctica]UOO85711.1 M23 family metallopeptidase [Neisseria arctica]
MRAPAAKGQSSYVMAVKGTYRMTSDFGPRGDIGIKGASRDHRGVDYATPVGTKLYAPESGRIIKAGKATGYGQAIYIQGDSGRRWEFGHLSPGFTVKTGQRIEAGQLLGRTGDTGLGNAHLHVTIRRNGVAVNPQQDAIWMGHKLK